MAYVTRLARVKAEGVYVSPGTGNWEQRTGTAADRAHAPAVSSSSSGRIPPLQVDAHILEKPRDADDAARMLRMLSGRTHREITGVAVVDTQGCEVAAEVTAVRFTTLSDAEIAEYVATGEPMDGAVRTEFRAVRRNGFLG